MATNDTYRIAHGFADHGLEDYTLSQYGHVTRYTLNPEPNPVSSVVQCDLSDPTRIPELDDERKFDLGLWQPPCNKWADPTSISGDPEDHPDLIDEAKAIAEKTCKHWIIENKPAAWNERDRDPTVVLEGKHVGKPVKYERAFETSFPVEQPDSWATIGHDTYETSSFFDSSHGKVWWAAYKGVPVDAASKGTISRNCVPASYLEHLLCAWDKAVDEDLGKERTDYSDYDGEMDAKRAREQNASLEEFAADAVATDGGERTDTGDK